MSERQADYELNGDTGQTASEGSLSESETKGASPSVMLENVQVAHDSKNTSGTSGYMSKAEALAILWTGLEALAQAGEAELHRSDERKLVLAILHGVDFDPTNGLVERK